MRRYLTVSTVPFEDNPGFYRHLMVLVMGLCRFLAPAFYCRSWAPWFRIIITVFVVVVLVLGVRSVGLLLAAPMM